MNCKFVKYEDGYRCTKCGFVTYKPNVKKNCITPPNKTRRIWNFTKAAISHFVKGNPTVSEEVLKERHEICKSCPLFKKNTGNPEWGVCTAESCGCNIKDTKDYLNKIGWADQECPEGKWGKVE